MLALNLNRDVEDSALFEAGTVFGGTTDKVDERPALAIGATGRAFDAKPADFYDLKGTLETLLAKFSSRSVYFDRLLLPAWLHPGRSARAVLDGTTVAHFGQLHPGEADRRSSSSRCFLGEIYLDRLYKQALRQPIARELSRFQPVRRDFSLLFPDSALYVTIEDALPGPQFPDCAASHPKRDSARIKSIPVGTFLPLARIVFQSQERTCATKSCRIIRRKLLLQWNRLSENCALVLERYQRGTPLRIPPRFSQVSTGPPELYCAKS